MEFIDFPGHDRDFSMSANHSIHFDFAWWAQI